MELSEQPPPVQPAESFLAGTEPSAAMHVPLRREVPARFDDRPTLDEEYQRHWSCRMDNTMSHYRKSVWKYKAESVVGPRVLLVCMTSHWIQTRRSTIIDFSVLIGFFVTFFVSFRAVGGFTDEQLQRTKDLTTDFHALCTFLIGFYMNTCLGRWWAIRSQGIGGLWGNLDDIILLLSCYFPRDDEADRAIHERVLRWGALSHELIYKQVQESSDLSDLVSVGLLTPEERDILQPMARQQLCSLPQVVWAWQVSFIGHLAYGNPEHGGSRLPYPVTVMPQLHDLCMKARDAIGGLFTYTDTQVPLRYLTVMSLVVWCHNIIQCMNSAATIDVAWQRRDTTAIAVEIIFLCVYPTVYLSLLHVGASMLCPLKDKNDVDLPHGAFTYWMLRENRSFHDGTCMPYGPPHGSPPLWTPPPRGSGADSTSSNGHKRDL